MPESSSSSPEPRRLTVEQIFGNGFHLYAPGQLPPTPQAEMDRKYAHIFHYQGYPVFDLHTTDLNDIKQALADYRSVYVHGKTRTQGRFQVIQLFADRHPYVNPSVTSTLGTTLVQMHAYERQHGEILRALTFGRPIRRIHPASSEVPVFRIGDGPTSLNLHELRDALARTGRIQIIDTFNALRYSLRLNEYGVALGSPEHLPRRIRKRNEGDGHHADTKFRVKVSTDDRHHLAKRMNAFNTRDPRKIEFYSSIHYRQNSELPVKTPVERGVYYADVLHHDDGTPILFPANDDQAYAKSQQALVDHRKFWIVGSPSDRPREIIAMLHGEGGRIVPTGSDAVLTRVMRMNQFEVLHGRVAKHLVHGPPFPPRATSFAGRLAFNKPSWRKVQKDAEVVSADRPMSEIWSKLHQNGILAVREGDKVTGFVLDKSGKVLHQVLETGSSSARP